uniref:hypothetical protein n=1 Tax=Helicobacter pylori TaxID=210 RepID=UPI001E584B13
FCCKNILNSNRFTIGLILPDSKKKKKILGYFNLFIFRVLIFVTIKLFFEFYHQYLMGIEF